jgi:Zn-dependent peptidase ImmA (M78 family)
MGIEFLFERSNEEKKMIEEVKEVVEFQRIKWAKKGICDVFEILENESLLIRYPLKTRDISAFTTFLDNEMVVFLNSSFTLGHEIFSGAHEFGHLVFDKEKLMREHLLKETEKMKKKADQFAVEFLLPEIGIKEQFEKRINVTPKEIKYKHIIKMQNTFKVSYKAMLIRLIDIGLCDKELYDNLKQYCTLEMKDKLQEYTKNEGYECNLIKPSNKKYISIEYEEIMRQNYESGKISYKKLESLLEFIDKLPEDYGYIINEDDY